MDVMLAYTQYQQEKAEAKRTGTAPRAPEIPINTLEKMIERTRQQ